VDQRVQKILQENPEFKKRYERMKQLHEEGKPVESLTGLSDEMVEHVFESIRNKFKFDLPEDYLTFLKLSNGFYRGIESGRLFKFSDWSDCDLPPVDGGYAFGTYGDEGYFIYAAKKGIFYSFDRCSHDHERAYGSFSDLLDYMLGLEVREGGIRDCTYEDLYDGERDELYEEYEDYYANEVYIDNS